MEEKSFFEHGGVKVTNARFVVDGQTLLAIQASLLLGIVVMAVAAYYLYKQKAYHVMLRTSGGETKALTTNEREYLIDPAINLWTFGGVRGLIADGQDRLSDIALGCAQ